MADKIVPLRGAQQKDANGRIDPVVAEGWIACLEQAVLARREQLYAYPFKTADEVRDLAIRIGPLAGEHGLESPVTYRAVAALVTICHPVVLALMLAGVPTKAEARARQRRGRRS